MCASSSFEANVIADGLRNSPLCKEWHEGPYYISGKQQIFENVSHCTLSWQAGVHNLLGKETSFQVEGQKETDPGSKPLIWNGLNRFMQPNAVTSEGLTQQSSKDQKLLHTAQLCPLQSCSSNEGELQDFVLRVKLPGNRRKTRDPSNL